MKNFLFEDEVNGGYFFVEAATIGEAMLIADSLECDAYYTGGVYNHLEAEILGYDTY